VGLSSSVIIRLTWLWWGFYSSGIFDGDMATFNFFQLWWRSSFVEFYFWWSFLSGGVFLHTALALPSGGDFFSPTTAAVLTCPLWWSFGSGIVCSHSNHGAVI